MAMLRAIATMLLVLVATAGPALAQRLSVTGDVTYRERVLMPAGSVLTVSLVDLAAPETAIVSARATTADRGAKPFRFTLNFDEGVIRPGRGYGLVADLESADGKYWFRTAEPLAFDASASASVVIVTAFMGSKPSPAEAFAAFFDLTFEVAAIGGVGTVTGKEPSFSVAADMRASGRSGCNNWFAQAQLDGEALQFSPVAATRMACADAALQAQEVALFAALAATREWAPTALGIDLKDANGKVVATLERATID